MFLTSKEEVRANMEESYRIAKTEIGVKEVLGVVKNQDVVNLLENFFYLGFVYGGEWTVEKIKDKLPNKFLKELMEVLKDARGN